MPSLLIRSEMTTCLPVVIIRIIGRITCSAPGSDYHRLHGDTGAFSHGDPAHGDTLPVLIVTVICCVDDQWYC